MKRLRARKRKHNKLGYGQLEDRKLLAADLISPATATDTEAAINSDVVLSWNSLFQELLLENTEDQNPGYASRAMAILNLAIYDAVAVANGDASDAFFDYSNSILRSAKNISAEVAASEAAYTVLSSLYSEQQATIDAFYDGTTESNSSNLSISRSVGTDIGNTIIAERADDGYDLVADYAYVDEIGQFQPDPLNPDVPVWGPAWGQVETFSISAAEDFVPPTTPALDSLEYAESYNEVLELGSVDSTTRTADQTEAGIFWAYDREGLGTPIALFRDVLETISIQEGNSFEENAALYAQASVAMADAGIVAWQTKFGEEFWRPVTAIKEGDNDDNPLTEGDTEWTALGAPDGGDDIIGFTPQFPTYISGHATFGGALFGAIQEFYGTDDIAFDLASSELEILMKSPELQADYGLELDDATRSFSSLSEAMAENGRSRVYLGIHFDFDDIVGQEVGQAVAASVASDFVVTSDDDSRRRDRVDRNSDDRNRNDNDRRDRRRNIANQRGRMRGLSVNNMSLMTSLPMTSLSDNSLESQMEEREFETITTDDAFASLQDDDFRSCSKTRSNRN